MKNQKFKAVVEALLESKNIAVISHYNPDADAYGSSCGLTLALLAMGKNVSCLNESGLNTRLSFIPGVKEVRKVFPLEPVEIVVVCDCGDISRVGESLIPHVKTAQKIINIDHHASNTKFGTINIVEESASSTSELIFLLLKEMRVKISSESALALFAGIMSDTGSFRYSCTSGITFEVAKELVELGVNPYRVAQGLYSNNSLAAVKLQAEGLRNLNIIASGKVAFVILTKEIFALCGAEVDEADHIVELARDVEGVLVSCLIRWQDGIWRVSMRSRDAVYDVSKVAEGFGGGGHKVAAAFRWRKTLPELEGLLKEALSRLVEVT